LRRAEEGLIAAGLRLPEAREQLEEATALLDNSHFWRHPSDGLAIFIARDFFRHFRVPREFESMVHISRRFHIKPLLPLLSGDGRFYVLALSQKQVRLLQGSRYSVQPIDIAELPVGLAEALRWDDVERQLQWHSGTTGPGGQGERAAMYFGHGSGEENDKVRILRYLQKIDGALNEFLADRREPLVLAGVEYLMSMYREANTYRNLAEGGVSGSPEGLSDRELGERAWAIVEPLFAGARDTYADLYRQLAGSSSPQASDRLEEIVPAAQYGRVDTLFVAEGHQAWGRFDATGGSVEIHQHPQPGDEELLDLAAAQTILSSGAVFVVPEAEMPSSTAQAAVYRY
jgi:hypothetical protein